MVRTDMRKMASVSILLTSVLFLAVCATSLPLEAQENSGYLRTKCKPSSAGVFVDGEYYGVASRFEGKRRAIALPPGSHQVRLVDPRYRSAEVTIQVRSGETEMVRERLEARPAAEPPFGRLRIKYPEPAAVYINEQYYGEARELSGVGKGLLLKPGKYTLRIAPVENGTPWRQEFTIAEGQTTSINLTPSSGGII
jgi:hypothetical protein